MWLENSMIVPGVFLPHWHSFWALQVWTHCAKQIWNLPNIMFFFTKAMCMQLSAFPSADTFIWISPAKVNVTRYGLKKKKLGLGLRPEIRAPNSSKSHDAAKNLALSFFTIHCSGFWRSDPAQRILLRYFRDRISG